MINPRQLLTATFTIALVLLSSSHAGAIASSQFDERERGIQLYERDDLAGAIRVLQPLVKKYKNDIQAWHYLGLSFGRLGKTNAALKAHAKASKLGSQLIKDKSKGEGASTEPFRRLIPFIKELSEAADSADQYLGLSSKPSAEKVWEWRERTARLRGYAEISEELRVRPIFASKDVTTRARIISKPSPEYTEEARKNQVTGTVVLLLVLSADGKVLGSIATVELSYGLTEKSIEAARKIKFVPAVLDGKPVSQFVKVEYNFNIY